MADEELTEEHPTITLADKVGQKVAEHVTRASAANAATETARRHASTVAIAESLRNDLKPAMAEYFGTIIEQLPDDDPTRKFYELFMSPESVLNDAVINIMGFVGMIIACISETGKVFFQPLLNELWSSRPRMPMSPADVANAVVQGYMTLAEGETEAAYSGLDTKPFRTMVEVTGMPPSPQDLFQMFRRSIIPEGKSPADFPSVYAGLAEGHTKDSWIPIFQKLAYVWPSPTDFVNAAVREQVPYATASEWAGKTGLDTTTEVAAGIKFFDLLFDVAGRPPGPEQMARMAHRGIIPWGETAPPGLSSPPGGALSQRAGKPSTGPTGISFAQGIAESDLKTKWTDWLAQINTYVLSNGEISNMVRHGFIEKADAPAYYAKNGVPADLAALMMESALVDQLAEDRQLAKGEVVALYTAQHLTADEATNALAAVGYHGEQAKEILWLADFRREAQAYNRVIQVLGRQVVMGKLSVNNATQTLGAMGVPSKTITVLTDDWKLAQQAETPNITEAQITSAVYYGIETIPEGYADLQALGYTPYDAWRLLSIRLHAPASLPGGPPQRLKGPQL